MSDDIYIRTVIGSRINWKHCGRSTWRTVRDVMRKNLKCAALVRINGYDFWVKQASIRAIEDRNSSEEAGKS